MGSFQVKFSFTVAFILGFLFGYKAREWRILWLKRRRDRLADKLKETQANLDLLTKTETSQLPTGKAVGYCMAMSQIQLKDLMCKS